MLINFLKSVLSNSRCYPPPKMVNLKILYSHFGRVALFFLTFSRHFQLLSHKLNKFNETLAFFMLKIGEFPCSNFDL